MSTEASKSGRGRPRKVVEVDSLEDVNPIVETQQRINRDAKELKKHFKVVDTWYCLQPAMNAEKKMYNKVLKRTLKANGNQYTLYVGRDSQCRDLLSQWSKEGKLRTFEGDAEVSYKVK